MINESNLLQNELFGAWRALGLTAAPRVAVEGITFVCFCGAWRVDVSEHSAKCSKCDFEAFGEPWEIARSFAAQKAAETAHGTLSRPPLNVKRLYAALDEQHPTGYPGAPGLLGIRIGFECPRCGPGVSHLSIEMFAVTCRACSWTANGEAGSESEIASSILAAWKGGAN